MKIREAILLTAISLCFVSSVKCQTAGEIVNCYIESIGGQNALDSIQTMKIVRDYTHVEEKLVERGTYYFKRPDFYRYENGNSLVCVAVSGAKAWRKVRESVDKPWQQWETIEHSVPFILNWLGPFLDYQIRGIKLEYISGENVDDADLFHLRMTTSGGRNRDIYFDKETCLLVKINNKVVSDYHPIGSILFPYRGEGKITLPGRESHFISTIVSVEINIPLHDSIFAPKK